MAGWSGRARAPAGGISLDFENSVYWTRTNQNQLKVANGTATSKGNAITGFVGDTRNFNIDTAGFDAHNTSRFDTGPVASPGLTAATISKTK